MVYKKKANAKINLILDLRCILPDRYHGIFTCMQSVSLADEISLDTVQDNTVSISCSDGAVPCDERNTCYKAARLFLDLAGINTGADIHIEKNIPSGAGLAGGSADAAAVLAILNEIYPDRISESELLRIALTVGADVPFCFKGGTALCQNKGEIITSLPAFDSWLVIVKPPLSISTKTAYEKFDTAEDVPVIDTDTFLFYASKGDYKKALAASANIFEYLLDIPQGENIKRSLYEQGAYFSMMSGSGSAYFALFDSREAAEKCAAHINKKYEFVRVCSTKLKGTE